MVWTSLFSDKDSISYLPLEHPDWVMMLERYETVNLGTDEELTRSLTSFSKQVNIGMAAQSAASGHSNGVTKAVMK